MLGKRRVYALARDGRSVHISERHARKECREKVRVQVLVNVFLCIAGVSRSASVELVHLDDCLASGGVFRDPDLRAFWGILCVVSCAVRLCLLRRRAQVSLLVHCPAVVQCKEMLRRHTCHRMTQSR